MTAAFYEHANGSLHFRAPAGGGGSEWDAPATQADIKANPDAYERYLAAKNAPTPVAVPASSVDMAAVQAAHDALKAMETENASLSSRVTELETLLAAHAASS